MKKRYAIPLFFLVAGITSKVFFEPPTPPDVPKTPQQVAEEKKTSEEETASMGAYLVLKKILKDPDSLQLISLDHRDGWTCIEYRARNSFNGMTVDKMVTNSKTVATSDSAMWNKHCAGEGFHDYKGYVEANHSLYER